MNLISDIKALKEQQFKEAGKEADVPPIVFVEKNGKILTSIVAPEVDKVKGLNVVALAKLGFDPDSITLAVDAKIYKDNNIERFEDGFDKDKYAESLKNKFPNGLCDKSISEENKKLIKDCILTCTVDRQGQLSVDMIFYEYQNGEIVWLEPDKDLDFMKGTSEGFVPDTMKAIMTEKDYLLEIVPGFKNIADKIKSADEKDRFIAARAIMSVCATQGCKIVDNFSKEHPEWIDFEERTQNFLSNFASRFFPQEALDVFASLVKTFNAETIEDEVYKTLRKNPYWSPQNLRNEDSYVQFAKIFKQVCFDPSVSDVSALAGAISKVGGLKRVRVWNGDQTEYYGEGNYSEDVEVYFCKMPDGEILSEANPEIPMKNIPEGGKLVKLKNPKIVLDSGRIVYGCQTWWEQA